MQLLSSLRKSSRNYPPHIASFFFRCSFTRENLFLPFLRPPPPSLTPSPLFSSLNRFVLKDQYFINLYVTSILGCLSRNSTTRASLPSFSWYDNPGPVFPVVYVCTYSSWPTNTRKKTAVDGSILSVMAMIFARLLPQSSSWLAKKTLLRNLIDSV